MKYKFGSNYVPDDIAMSRKEEEKTREVIGIIDDYVYDSGNAIQYYNRKFKRIWPLHIYPCQKFYLFGANMYAVTSFQVRVSWMIWLVSSLLFKC